MKVEERNLSEFDENQRYETEALYKALLTKGLYQALFKEQIASKYTWCEYIYTELRMNLVWALLLSERKYAEKKL